MPYPNNDDLPDSVKAAIPSTKGKSLFREVVNSQLDSGKSEAVSFASAWAALENAGYAQNEKGKWVKVGDIDKRQINDDVFSTREEAIGRSVQLGMGGEIHVHENEGQAFYMPGESHDKYIEYYEILAGKEKEDTLTDDKKSWIISEIINALMSFFTKRGEELDKVSLSLGDKITKIDDEQRIVYGWASVVTINGEPVVDRQGDIISPTEMEKAASEFMLNERVAKEMHNGDQVGEVIHSLPLTNDIAKSLGISSDREGHIIAMKINDDDVWQRVKSGELKSFSIGGEGIRDEVE